LQSGEVRSFLIPDDEIATPVKRLRGARHDAGHQAKTLRAGPAGKLHEIAHMHVLVTVIEIKFPTRQRIGHHEIGVAVLALGRFARTRSSDRPLRQSGGAEHQHEARRDGAQLRNVVHPRAP
jgi:hypothetical protein